MTMLVMTAGDKEKTHAYAAAMYAERLRMAQAVFRNGAGPFVIHVKTKEFAAQHNRFTMMPSGEGAAVHIPELSSSALPELATRLYPEPAR